MKSREGEDKQLTYTYPQAARLLGVNVKTLRKMIARGQLSPVVVCDKPRIPRDELERFGRSPGTK